MTSFIEFLSTHWQELLNLIFEHIRLTSIAVLIAIVIGLLLGILISSIEAFSKPVIGFANIMQAVPSLAALGLLVPFMGIGSPPAIFMVVLYSLLPILKNTYTGITKINPDTIEAAYGIGMTHTQVLFRVKLPLALPVIMSGVRIASVTAVGLMTIAAYIGAGGLGNYVISGIQTSNTNLMLCGAIPACILALLMDFLMSKIEKAVVPISLAIPASQITKKKIHSNKVHKRVTITVVIILLIAIILGSVTPLIASKDKIVVSSKPEVEGQIMGHIIADVIEDKTDLEVDRNLGLGATKIIYNAITSGDIDIYPEYSGSVYSGIFGITPPPGADPKKTYEDVRKKLAGDDLVFLDPYGFNNRYTLGVTPEFAKKYSIKTISDLQKVPVPLILACDQEFPHRADGIPALNKRYDSLKFDKHLQFQGALMYEALMTDEVNVMTPFTTDALLAKYDIQILEDDREALSNYYMATLIRKETLDEYPELLDALKCLEGVISDEEMSKMNYRVVVDGKDTDAVAREFLQNKGIIK